MNSDRFILCRYFIYTINNKLFFNCKNETCCWWKSTAGSSADSRSLRPNWITNWQHAALRSFHWTQCYTWLADFRTPQQTLKWNLIGCSHSRCLRGSGVIFSFFCDIFAPRGTKTSNNSRSRHFRNIPTLRQKELRFYQLVHLRHEMNPDARYGNTGYVINALRLYHILCHIHQELLSHFNTWSQESEH